VGVEGFGLFSFCAHTKWGRLKLSKIAANTMAGSKPGLAGMSRF